MKKIGINIFYQSLYQIFNIVLPLMTAPYLARVLGAEKQGIFSYTQSIVDFFVLFAMLGIVNYGTRRIAECHNSISDRSSVFFEIFIIQFICSLIMIIIYIIFVFTYPLDNKIISLIQTFSIIACLFDINWFFFGIEEFKLTAFRNIIVKICSVLLIFFVVKNQGDLWKYTLIMAGNLFISNLLIWFYLPKYICFTKIRIKKIKTHIKPIVLLFIPLVAVSIYHIMDKTMLGILSTYTETGYYYNADKIINIPLGILLAIINVLFPRIVIILNEKGKDYFDFFFIKSVDILLLFSIIFTFGISAISFEFVPWFFGENFKSCISLILLLSPVMIIKTLSSCIRYFYLIPKKKEKIFIISVVVGSFFNIIFNYFMIPSYGALGAVGGTLLAEFIACLIQYLYIKTQVNLNKTMLMSFLYIIIGLVMFSVIRLCSNLELSLEIKILVETILGVIIFFIFSILFSYIFKSSIFYWIRKNIYYGNRIKNQEDYS